MHSGAPWIDTRDREIPRVIGGPRGRGITEDAINEAPLAPGVRPGTIVELKAGLFGLKPPENLAVYLDRVKRKKEHRLVVLTLKGSREVAREQVTARRFATELDPGAGEEALAARLRSIVADHGAGRLAAADEAGAEAEGEWGERRLWELLVPRVEEPLPPERLVALVLGREPSRAETRRMEEVLAGCRRRGVGFFELEGRNTWRPVPVADFKAFHQAMEANHRLRKRLLAVRTVADDSGEEFELLVGVHPAAAGLDAAEDVLLTMWAEALASYVLHDSWRDDVVPQGTGVHTLMGQSYHRFLEHFVLDWTGVQGVSRSSAALQFLVDGGLLEVREAIRLVARRRVLAAPGFTWDSPEEIERWAERYVEPADEAASRPAVMHGRIDLRDLETYTIDPVDAKDFDDAVSLVENGDGTVSLWVHVADVSHYVEKDSRLDHHARDRATSVYLPTGVLPMLPKRLSENLCSLRSGVDRFAMSVRIDTDAEGKVVGSEPRAAVIRVRRNAHYQEADEAIATGGEPFASLHALAERMRRHRRGLELETGELRIRFAEEAASGVGRLEGVWEGDGAPGATDAQPRGPDPVVGLSIQVKRGSPATKMIETFMVAANEAVSRFVAAAGAAVPYRCHPLPERAKVERFSAEAKILGLDVTLELPDERRPAAEDVAAADEDAGSDSLLAQLKSGKLQLGGFVASETIGSKKEDADEPTPAPRAAPRAAALRGLAQLDEATREAYLKPFRAAQAAVERIDDPGIRDLAYQKLLSTLGRAYYSPTNVGHFGLGSVSYAHFTSPIRRYPDLVLHRQLKWVLAKEGGDVPHAEAHLAELSAHCSTQAEAAERLERGLLSACLVFESRREEWQSGLVAVVQGITPGGVFLMLPGNLEAHLAMRDIPGGPYEVDEHGTMVFRSRFARGSRESDPEDVEVLSGLDWRELEDPVTGEIREVRLKLGDRVRVQIRERDLVEGRVRVRLSS